MGRDLKDREHAIDFLVRHEHAFEQSYEFYDVLATTHGRFADLKAARKYGTRSLELKHDRHGKLSSPSKFPPVPPFIPQPDRNIIAFSLFGSNPRYVQPLLLSAELRSHIYPLWTIRIYVDQSVPAELVRTFEAKACQVVRVNDAAIPGTFWRFLAADDAQIDRFLFRDADSILNIRDVLRLMPGSDRIGTFM